MQYFEFHSFSVFFRKNIWIYLLKKIIYLNTIIKFKEVII